MKGLLQSEVRYHPATQELSQLLYPVISSHVLPAASLPHWLFWEYREAGSALKTLDFPEQVLHVAHQLGTSQKGTDYF